MKTSQNFLRALSATLGALGLITLVACEAKVDGGNFPALPPPNVSEGVKVDGLWKTDCVPVSGVYTIVSVQFAGNTMKVLADIYTGSTCATKYPGTTTSESNGTFALAGQSSSIANAVNIDYTLTDKTTGEKDVVFDVVLVENNIMYLGATKGTSPNQRPTQLDRTMAFKKR